MGPYCKDDLRKEILTFLGVGLTVGRVGVMVGLNTTKFGDNRRFEILAVGDKMGKETEGGGEGGGGGNDGLTMYSNFYQREIL